MSAEAGGRAARLAAAMVAAALSPVPMADELVLAPAYALLAVRVARRRGLAPGALPWRRIARVIGGGLAARAVVTGTLGLVPGVAAVANGVSAWWLTGAIAERFERACDAHRAAAEGQA